MMSDFEYWKEEKISSLQKDINYHKNKLEDLEFELKIYLEENND